MGRQILLNTAHVIPIMLHYLIFISIMKHCMFSDAPIQNIFLPLSVDKTCPQQPHRKHNYYYNHFTALCTMSRTTRVSHTHTHTHNRFTAGMEYVRVHHKWVQLSIIKLLWKLIAFSALTRLVGWQEGHLACKTEWWATGMVFCQERGANDLYMVQLMPLPPHHLLLH